MLSEQQLTMAFNLPDVVNPAATAILTTVLAVLLFLYYLFRKPKASLRPPPQAGGAWPVFGHLHLLAGSQPPHITLANMADKYGPIFTIRMGVHRALIVSSWEIAKECFTTNDKAFANRPKAVALEHKAYNYAMFGFSPYGPYWRQLRKIVTLELLSNHRLQMLSHVRQEEVKTAIRDIYQKWNNDNNNNNREEVDMKKWFGDLTLNVALRMIVGKRYVEEEEEKEENDEQCKRAIREFFKLMGTFVLADAIPYLRWLDLGGYERDMKRTGNELDQMLEKWLEEHKRIKRDSGEGICNKKDDDRKDFMGVMLSILDDPEEISSYDADTIIKSACLSLILGGTDTTSVTMTWALALLLNNRDSLRRVQQELDENVGRERQVRESDVKNLIYLQAVIKETLRLYPAGPLLAPHESSEDCTVGGYHIPAGTRLLVNASKLHRDPNVWSDPLEFRPERFLTTHKDVEVGGQNFEMIPFGTGRRICPGISFSLQVLQLALAYLLHGFEVTTLLDEPIDMRETVGLSNLLASSLDVLVTPRLPTEAY